MSNFTPAPWYYSSGAVWADENEEIGIATRISDSPILPYVRDANLRLCSRAPRLLEACERAVRFVEGCMSPSDDIWPEDSEAVKLHTFLREAIQEATGQ